MSITVRQSSSLIRASRPSRVSPALLTRMSRSPAASTSAQRRRGVGDVGLHGATADLPRDLLGLVLAAAVADDDRRAGRGELDRDRAADPTRGARDECRLPVERAEPAHDREGLPSLLQAGEVVDGERAHALVDALDEARRARCPGPTSTNVVTPSWTSSRAACVNLTGAVSWSTSSEPSRVAGSILAVTVDMNGAIGSWKRTRSIAGLSRLPALRDERAVERPGDLQLDGSSCAEALGLGAALLNCVVLTGDDDLAGAVVVRRPHAQDLACTASRPPRPRDRGSRPSSPGARGRPRPSPGRARGRARSPRGVPIAPTEASAENSPTEWPTTTSGSSPASRIAARMARHVATSAGCCTSVSTRSSSGESKQSFWRSRPDASLPTR